MTLKADGKAHRDAGAVRLHRYDLYVSEADVDAAVRDLCAAVKKGHLHVIVDEASFENKLVVTCVGVGDVSGRKGRGRGCRRWGKGTRDVCGGGGGEGRGGGRGETYVRGGGGGRDVWGWGVGGGTCVEDGGRDVWGVGEGGWTCVGEGGDVCGRCGWGDGRV